MAYQSPPYVQALCTNSGLVYTLTITPVTKRRPFSTLSDGATVTCNVSNGTTPPSVHEFIGTYSRVGTGTVTAVTTTSGAALGAGTHNIIITPIELLQAPWIDPTWPTGFVVRGSTPGALHARQVKWEIVGGLADDFIVDLNPTGVGGDVIFRQQGDPLFRNSAASDAQRTMNKLILAGADQVKFTTSPLKILGPNGTTALQIDQSGVSDFRIRASIGGVQKDILTGSGVFGKGAMSASETIATVLSETTITMPFSVPSNGGPYEVECLAVLNSRILTNANGSFLHWGSVYLDLQVSTDGASWNTLNKGRFYKQNDNPGDFGQDMDDIQPIHVLGIIQPAVAGTTYRFRINAVATVNDASRVTAQLYTDSGSVKHSISAKCYPSS